MIAKTHRFHGRGSLNHVYSKGRTVRGESLSLRVAESNKSDYRLAVVVSKKVSKSAVVRNRIRRRIYEIIRTEKKNSSSAWLFDIVITVFDERLAHVPADDVRSSVIKLLKKSGITNS